MSERARATRDLRQAVGRALRGVREKGAFSLDDLARAAQQQGVGVSRSHLSRVENGEADLSLPRFLVLMRVLGEARDTVLADLDARLAAGRASLESLLEEARAARRRHEHERAAERLAAAFVIDEGALGEDELAAWLHAEAALGRWRSASRIGQLRLSRPGLADEGIALLEGAVALLGAGQLRASLAFARAAGPHADDAARVVEAATLVALGRCEEALERVGTLRAGEGLGLLVAGSAYLALERPRAAMHASRSALELATVEPLRAESQLALAAVEGSLRRPAVALRRVARALPVARSLRLIELGVRAHRLAHTLHRRLGRVEDARSAARAARALARRAGADRTEPSPLPFQALMALATQSAGAGGRPSRE